MPRVIIHFFRIVPKKSPILDTLIDYADAAYCNFPDDVTLAHCFIQACLDGDCGHRCAKVIPLLLNSLWCCPISCCAAARLFLELRNFDNSIFCLNAAFFTRQFHRAPPAVLESRLPRRVSKKAPRLRPTLFEGDLVSSQLTGVSQLIYKTTVELARITAPARFRSLLKKFTSAPAREIPRGDSVSSPLDDEFAYLYDPGIFHEFEIPKVILELPLSPEFSALANSVIDDLQYREVMVGRKHVVGSDDIRRAALLALAMEDGEMFDAISVYLKRLKKFDVYDSILRLRLKKGEDWCPISRPPQRKVAKMTINEVHARLIFGELSEGISGLFVI
jgi:hypothetical protein